MNPEEDIEKVIADIRSKFPEVAVSIDSWLDHLGYEKEDYPYHSMFEAFSQSTTNAIKISDEDKASSYLNYVSKLLVGASPKLIEYIDVGYVESLMWDIEDKELLGLGWSLFPDNIKKLYIEVWNEPAF